MRRTTAIFAVLVMSAACSSAPGPDDEQLSGYRVVYRVVDAEPDAKNTSTEIVEVRRPYGGRVETRTDGETTTGRITSREHLWQLGDDGELEFGVLRPPGGPTRDASCCSTASASSP